MSERDYMRQDWGHAPRSTFWASYPGTKGLIAGLIGIHLLTELLRVGSFGAWQTLMDVLELHPEFVLQRFWIWQLVTGGLLHADFWHLLFNCIGIWFFGRVVEQRLGLRRYLWFTLAATVAAALAYLFWAVLIDSVSPALGASGAAMGMICLAALWYPKMNVLFFGVLPMQLWVLAAGFVLMDLFGALREPGGIAHSAHLGGALYAFLYWKFGHRFGNVFGAIDRMADDRKRKKERKRLEQDRELRAELDRVLDKVNREGMTALSEREKKFLKDASDRLRR
jgi:membrane associated rhomboid family serine protease